MKARTIRSMATAGAVFGALACAGCQSAQPHWSVQREWEDFWEFREMPELPPADQVVAAATAGVGGAAESFVAAAESIGDATTNWFDPRPWALSLDADDTRWFGYQGY